MTDWSATLRDLGPGGFATYAASRAAALIPGVAFHSYLLIAVPIIGMPDMPRGYSPAELDEDTVVAHAVGLDLPLAAIRHRFSQGMTCLAAMRDRQIVGVNFVTANGFDEDEVTVRFVPPLGAAWDTGLFIRPQDRGGRAFAALWAATATWLSSRDLDWSMSRIARYNVASIAAHARMGAIRVGQLSALKIGQHQWLFDQPTVVHLEKP